MNAEMIEAITINPRGERAVSLDDDGQPCANCYVYGPVCANCLRIDSNGVVLIDYEVFRRITSRPTPATYEGFVLAFTNLWIDEQGLAMRALVESNRRRQ